MNLATYRRPGLSVLTFAAKQDEFAEFLDATLAHVEQVVVVTVGRPPSPALAPNPKLTLVALPESPWEDAETSRRAFRAAEAVLDTQWVLYLDPQERLDATGFAKLRAALYHLGPRAAALPMGRVKFFVSDPVFVSSATPGSPHRSSCSDVPSACVRGIGWPVSST